MDTSEAGITPPPSDDDEVSLLPTPVNGTIKNELILTEALKPHEDTKENGAATNEDIKPILHPFNVKTEPLNEETYIETRYRHLEVLNANPRVLAGLCAYPLADQKITFELHTQEYPFCGLEHAIKGGAVKDVYNWRNTPTYRWNGKRCIPLQMTTEETWIPINKEPWPNHTPAFQEAALPIQKNLIQHLRMNNLLDKEMKKENDHVARTPCLHMPRPHLNPCNAVI